MTLASVLTPAFIIGVLAATVRMATPLLFAGLGETFGQRSGVLNLGLEGIMAVGALAGFGGAYFFGSPWAGVATGLLAGGLFGLVMALMSVGLQANQVITGVMLFIIAGGLVTFLNRVVFGGSYIPPRTAGFEALPIPVLSEIPVLGPILFRQNVLVYLAFLLVPLLAAVMTHTTWGLRIRAVGDNPRAADSLGVNVYAVRYWAVIFGGALAGLGGAFLPLGYMNMFADNITAGRGWIAIALVIFGRWNPYMVLAGSLLFGGVDAIQLRLQALGLAVPYQFMLMAPYVLTILALLSMRGRVEGPGALTVPYRKQ